MTSSIRLAGLLAVLPALALAQDKVDLNTISKVEVNGGTVEITGTKKPNFTTFTMTDPPRLVIDISEAVFSNVPDEMQIGNGSVTAIKTASYGSDASAIARVLIGFTKDVETDIQAHDSKLVVKVLAGGAAPAVAAATPQAPAAAPDDSAKQAQAQADAAAKADADKKAQAQADADAAAKADADKKAQAQAQADAAAKADADKKAQEQAAADSAAKADADKKAQEQAAADSSAKAEADRKAQEQAQADSSAKSDADRRAQEKQAAQAAAEEKKQKQEEAKQAALDAKKQKQEEAKAAAEDKKKKQEEARQAAIEEKKQKQEEAKAAAEQKKKQREEERQARLDAKKKPHEEKVAMAEPSHNGSGQAVSSKRKTMTRVGFKQEAATSRVVVHTNEPVRYTVEKAGDKAVVVELENTKIDFHNNERPLDTSYFDTAVATVTPEASGHSVRIEIKLKESVPYEASQTGNELAIAFQRPAKK